MISEITNAIKAHLYDRVTSPLAGAVIISWCLWNYPVLITLLSSLEPHQKIQFIQTSLADYQRSLVYPFATSLFFIFLYPFPSMFAYWFWRKQKKLLRDIKQKIEDEELLTKEESRDMRRAMHSLQIEYDKEIERKNVEVDDFKEDVKRLESESRSVQKKIESEHNESGMVYERKIKELEKRIEELSVLTSPEIFTRLSNYTAEILRDIGNRKLNQMDITNFLIDKYNAGHAKTALLFINELVKRGLIIQTFDDDHEGYYYGLTDAGRDYVTNLLPKGRK